MRILVGQAFIGDFQAAFGPENKPNVNIKRLYLEEFIPRVIGYCSNHDYQYGLLTTPKLTFPHKKYQFHAQKMWYLSQYMNYDYFLWLDIDVLVQNNSPKFPFSPGLTAVLDCASSRGAILSQHPYVQVPFDRYFNSGVWGIDSLSAKKLWENGVSKLLEGGYKRIRRSSDGRSVPHQSMGVRE